MKNTHSLYTLFFSVLFLLFSQVVSAQIFINEFVASNDTGITDESGSHEDWVELYNAGSTPVNIADYYLSDDPEEPTLWQIPNTAPNETTITAGGHLILWFDKDTEEGVLHVNAKLSGNGESIVLTAPDGVSIVDTYTFGAQTADVSEGRTSDGAATFTFFTTPTPNEANVQSSGPSPIPVFSAAGGLYEGSQTISITTPTPALIYYTTDGSIPNESSNLYTEPLTLDTPTALRAVSVAAGMEPSSEVTETYLIGVSHAYPIMAITGNPSDFFDEETGIFGNYEEDIEIIINAEFYETDGTVGFNQVVESELVGVSSAGNAQKSIALKAKGSLGNSKFEYAVFPDEDLTEYRSLMLRNSGNDWNVTQIRDASVSSLIRDLSDVDDLITPPQINYQAHRPAIMYLNGEYWGVYNLRERTDKRYIRHRFDLDDDEIDFIENKDEVKEGDIENWDALQAFLESNNFASEETFAQLADWVDVDEFMDYTIFNIFIDNQDWPGNNNRRFRERAPDGKWRFLSYDLDFTFGLFTSQGWNTGYAEDDALDRLLNPSDYLHPNPEWSARLFYKLIENEGWRNKFINRTADQMNVLYLPERINARLDEFVATFALEFEQQQAMWQNLYNQENNIELMRSFANARTQAVQQHYVATFSDVNSTVQISISTQPAGAGSVEFNTLNIDEEDDTNAWTGTYFTGIDIPVKAVAKSGYVFQYWEGISSDTDAETIVNLSQNGQLTAVFMAEDDDAIAQSINFSPIADQFTDAPSITLEATATSGLPVSFSLISGPASLNNDVLTLTGSSGTVVVRASQAGNAEYAAATPVDRQFEVLEPSSNFDCPNLNANVGDACDDNDSSTVNDTVQGDCTCSGTPISNEPDCSDITIVPSAGAITVTGLDGAPITAIKIFDATWSTIFDCFNDCDVPVQTVSLNTGTYYVYVKYFDAGYNFLCQEVQTIIVNEDVDDDICADAGGDSDNDGVCDDDDCQPDNPNIPASQGTACNDNNEQTTNDVIQADGCTCAGTQIPTNDCGSISVTASGSGITVNGLDSSPITSVQIFSGIDWSTEYTCFANCDAPVQFISLPLGDYFVYVKLYNSSYQLICEINTSVTVTNGFAGSNLAEANLSLRKENRIVRLDNLFSLYPNPASDYVSIQLNQVSLDPIKITLLDKLGRILNEDTIDSTDISNYQLDVSDNAAGVYFLRVMMLDGEFMTKRLIVVE